MTVAVFHPGMQHSRQTALALQQLGRLAFLATGVFDHEASVWRRAGAYAPAALRRRIDAEFGRFSTPGLDASLVRAFPQYELPERMLSRIGLDAMAQLFDRIANDRFGKVVARLAQDEGARALWGYDNSSLTAFNDPRSASATKILDRTIADWREWNAQVATIEDTHGDWLHPSLRRAPDWLIQRGEAEFEAADYILCASEFVSGTIKRHSSAERIEDKLRHLSYCFDSRMYGSLPSPTPPEADEPVRFLFAGQLSARKGIQHVLEAVSALPPELASLTCVGRNLVPNALLNGFSDRVRFLGAVPRAEMPAIMVQHDVLVLPSYFEGSAIVLLEAMAAGLAVIATPQAGLGPTARSGICIERPDSELLAAAMIDIAQDNERLLEMRRSAQIEAQRYDSAAYRSNIEALLDDIVG